MKRSAQFLLFISVFALGEMLFANTAPLVTNVSASQRTDGSKIVDIWYSVNDADNDTLTVSVEVSNDNGATFGITPSPPNLSGAIGENILSGINKHIIWNAGAEGVSFDGSQFKVKVTATEKINLSYGLVAYYPFNGNANDESGNSAHGTVFNASLDNDRFGHPESCYTFSGNGSYIQSSPNLPLGNLPRSISAWFNTNSTSGSGGWYYNTIVCWGHCQAMRLCTIGVYQGLLTFNDFYFSEFMQVFVSDGNWHHTIVAFDGSLFKFYLDGELIITANHTLNTASGSFYIGRRADEWNQFMNGRIDDVRVYNRSLIDSEIQALYHEGGWNGN